MQGISEIRGHRIMAAATRRSLCGRVRRLWTRILGLTHRPPRRLRLAESLALGDHRFVAIVEYEDSRFLLGGTSASLVLLARLEKLSEQPVESEVDNAFCRAPAHISPVPTSAAHEEQKPQ